MNKFRDTPTEGHELEGFGEVFVKREDLCAEPPMPPLSKMRGVHRLLTRLQRDGGLCGGVGVLDTRISKSGLGVAILCQDLGVHCRYYFPQTRAEKSQAMPDWRETARAHGAELVPLQAGRFAVVKARFLASETGYAMPVGLPLFETVLETARVFAKTDLCGARSVVVSVGTGTILAGIALGLCLLGRDDLDVLGVTASMSPRHATERAIQHLRSAVAVGETTEDIVQNVLPRVSVRQEGSDYYAGSGESAPWPIHDHYEGKALAWMKRNQRSVPRPCLFWNVGA